MNFHMFPIWTGTAQRFPNAKMMPYCVCVPLASMSCEGLTTVCFFKQSQVSLPEVYQRLQFYLYLMKETAQRNICSETKPCIEKLSVHGVLVTSPDWIQPRPQHHMSSQQSSVQIVPLSVSGVCQRQGLMKLHFTSNGEVGNFWCSNRKIKQGNR